MANFYIADTHFGHAAVIRFDRRPFSDVEQMEEVICMNWNAAVKNGDVVYILGDFCWKKEDEWLRVLNRLNGQKVLILGNHDIRNPSAALKNKFADIKDYKEIDDKGRKVILQHYPIMFYKHSQDSNTFMLCGHVHNTIENDCLEAWKKDIRNGRFPGCVNRTQIINVGACMPWINYTPRTLDEILRRLPKEERDWYTANQLI